MKIDPASIGADRIQNPETAIENATGKYKDPVDGMSPEERLPMAPMPKGPDKSPFTITGGGTGSRE